jgi:hypothetical protein
MMNLFLVAAITSDLDIAGAAAASAGPALLRCSRLIEFNDPRCDRLAALGCLIV